jgi:hypothetical protein
MTRTLSQPHVRGAATKRRNATASLALHRAQLDADLYRNSPAARLPEDAGGDVTLHATGVPQ